MESVTKYPPEIAEAISAVMGEVDYVQKRGENKFHGYKFAAVGDILAKLQPSMAKHGLIVIQNEAGHELAGTVMTAKYEFIVAHKSGAVLPERFIHTGVASASNTKGGFDDKCLNKCMTAARKYFLLALFQIPTGEEADTDEQEDRPNGHLPPRAAPPPRPVPVKEEPAEPKHAAWVRKAIKEIEACASQEAVMEWERKNTTGLDRLAEVDKAERERLGTIMSERFTSLPSVLKAG